MISSDIRESPTNWEAEVQIALQPIRKHPLIFSLPRCKGLIKIVNYRVIQYYITGTNHRETNYWYEVLPEQ